jgi:predicted branched-subunit amino acid permease
MANTKHSVAREIIIDRLLRERRGYSIMELWERVNNALDLEGFAPVSESSIRNDLKDVQYLYNTLFWASGCAVGIMAGSLLPQPMVTALSMSLYGMFLAIIIPPAHKDRNVLYALIASFVLSGLCAVAPVIGDWSSGMRTVVLTIVISAVAAWLKPIKTDDDGTA